MHSKINASLEGFEIGLFGSIPSPNGRTTTVQDRTILGFVALLSGLVFKYGGRILHGSNPAFTPVILRQAELHRAENGRAPQLVLFMSALWAKEIDAVERKRYSQVAELNVVPAEGEGGADNPETRRRSLTALRQMIMPRVNITVAIGGKQPAVASLPGVEEELILAREAKIPGFLAGGFGGITTKIAQNRAMGKAYTQNNHLEADVNETLFTTNNSTVSASIIFEHLTKKRTSTFRSLVLDAPPRPQASN